MLVTFESNWEKAKLMLTEIAIRCAENLSTTAQQSLRKAAQKYMIFYSKLTPVVYTSVVDSGVLLTIRYLTAPRHRRGSSEATWEEILRKFARCDDIDFAYPTQRFYRNPIEGKPGRQPEVEAESQAGARSDAQRDWTTSVDSRETGASGLRAISGDSPARTAAEAAFDPSRRTPKNRRFRMRAPVREPHTNRQNRNQGSGQATVPGDVPEGPGKKPNADVK